MKEKRKDGCKRRQRKDRQCFYIDFSGSIMLQENIHKKSRQSEFLSSPAACRGSLVHTLSVSSCVCKLRSSVLPVYMPRLVVTSCLLSRRKEGDE